MKRYRVHVLTVITNRPELRTADILDAVFGSHEEAVAAAQGGLRIMAVVGGGHYSADGNGAVLKTESTVCFYTVVEERTPTNDGLERLDNVSVFPRNRRSRKGSGRIPGATC